MNCLAHALNAWHEDGGYLVLRKSAARATPHVMHVGDEGLQHYSPGAPLGHPFHALIGFDGVVWDREMTDAPPARPRTSCTSATRGYSTTAPALRLGTLSTRSSATTAWCGTAR